jgi:hypothetical protein
MILFKELREPNENKVYQNMWDAFEETKRGEFTVLGAYIKNQEMPLDSFLKKLGKEE